MPRRRREPALLHRQTPPEPVETDPVSKRLSVIEVLSVPVVGLGIAMQYVSARAVMLVFVVLVAIAVVLCSRAEHTKHT